MDDNPVREIDDLGKKQRKKERRVTKGNVGREPESAAQLCGHCGDGALAVSPSGEVWPCVVSRWMPVGNVRHKPLREIVAAIPEARAELTAKGMPATVGAGATNCGPCAPEGGNCYPIHCHPRA